MKVIFKLHSLFLFSILLLCSCVGTIEDTETDTGSADELKIGKLNFSGITSATAISHNKVEITFAPAGGAKGDVTYLIKYDGLDEPITAIEKSLFKTFTGEYKYTVRNLSPFTTYSFNVTAIDDVSNAEGNNTNVSKATTFLQPTADFGGIGLVSSVQGLAGLNSLKVEWVKAPLYVDFGTPDPRDVVHYEVTILDAEFNPSAMNDTSVPSTKRRVLLVDNDEREIVVGGLSPGKNYHIQVRAINHGHVDNFTTDPTFRHEENTKYITKRTLTLGAGDVSFNEDSFLVQPINSESGLSSLNSTWTAASGAFNHYRIIYTKSTNNDDTEEAYNIESQLYFGTGHIGGTACTNGKNGTEPFDPDCACENIDTHDNDSGTPAGTDGEDDLFCVELEFSKENHIIANLDSYSNYDIMLLVCSDVNCINYNRSKVKKAVRTQPDIAAFEFETNMRGPSSFENIDYMFIDLKDFIDFQSGTIDGFQITVTDEDGNEAIIGNPTISFIPDDPPIRLKSFNPKTDSVIVLSGYNFSSQPVYDFKIEPFQYDGTTAFVDTSLKKEYKDVSFSPFAPGEYDEVNTFEGAKSCNDIGTNTGNYKITWDHPPEDSGIFSHYQIYLQQKGSPTDLSMDFATAITYPSIPLVDKNINEFTIEGLNPANNYIVSVRTYFNNNGTIVQSPVVDAEIVGCD